MNPGIRWAARGVGLMLCVVAVGCVPIGYAYPTLAHTPSVPLGLGQDEVYAFRISVAEDKHSSDQDEYVFSAVPLTRKGDLPAQTRLTFDYGWIWNCIAWSTSDHTHHTLLVRLYRPGCQTVEIKSWEENGQVVWQEAASLTAQEKAVDDLLATLPLDEAMMGQSERRPEGPGILAPGSASKAHKRMLLFAAWEYDRIGAHAAGSADAEATHTRILQKAKALRDLAEK